MNRTTSEQQLIACLTRTGLSNSLRTLFLSYCRKVLLSYSLKSLDGSTALHLVTCNWQTTTLHITGGNLENDEVAFSQNCSCVFRSRGSVDPSRFTFSWKCDFRHSSDTYISHLLCLFVRLKLAVKSSDISTMTCKTVPEKNDKIQQAVQ